MPLPAAVFVLADEFLFLGVHADHRAAGVLVGFDLLAEVAELGVPVGMLAAFGGLGVGLQAVPEPLEQPAHHKLADLMPSLSQRRGQCPGRLTGPPQRRHRIATSLRIDQPLQRRDQLRVMILGTLAPAPRPAGNPHRRRRRILQLRTAPPHRIRGNPHRLGDQHRPAHTQLPRLGAQPQPPLTLT